MNEVFLIGRVVRHPEVKVINDTTCVINNTLAINRPFRDQNGQEVTDFIPFVVWNKLAEIMGKYCSKGDQIALSGRMQSRVYQGKDQKKVYVVECQVNKLTLLSGPVNQDKASKSEADFEENFTADEVQEINKVVEAIKTKTEVMSS